MDHAVIPLAVADRPLTRGLLEKEALEVDYFETTAHLVEGAAGSFPRQPLLLHNSVWDWSLGHPEATNRRDVIPRTLRALKLTRAPWLSVHLAFSAAEVRHNGGMQALTEPLERDELFANVCSNVQALASHIPVPLILENLDYNPTGAYEHICEPDFITAVLEKADVGFLLDLAHARVSAARLGYTVEDYLELLPLHRVRQLHVSGPRWRDGSLYDAHQPLLETDYELLGEVLSRTEPLALTLEYGRDADALTEQLVRLRKMLGARP